MFFIELGAIYISFLIVTITIGLIKFNEKMYTFAMNGQTGKMVGDLPFDKQAFWKYVAIRGVLIGTILSALTCILRLLYKRWSV